MSEPVNCTPEQMAQGIIFATTETNRLLGSFLGDPCGILNDSAAVAQTMLDLLAACKAGRATISEVVMGLVFGNRTHSSSEVERIINRVIDEMDAAIAKAEQPST